MDSSKLLDSSSRWLQAGLAASFRDSSPNDLTVHHVGVALEHLLKGYLASLHPALIVEGANFESLLHATGYGHKSTVPSSQMKTIGLKEAFNRVKKLAPINVNDKEFEPLLVARNGVAHAATYDESSTRQVLITYARIAGAVLAELKIPPKKHWGDYLPFRNQLVDQHVTELQLAYTAKLKRAEERYRRRFADLNDDEISSVVQALNLRGAPFYYEGPQQRLLGECPACTSPGWMRGELWVDWNPEDDSTSVTLSPDGFDCAVCQLSLVGEELELAGLDSGVDVSEEFEGDEWSGAPSIN